MGKLQGKVAVVTGGATGIGFGAAKSFIEEGALVFIFGRRQEALDAAVADLGPNARAVKGSVSDLADLDRLYAAVKAERGTLDIVFANAGTGSPLPLGEITAEHIDEIDRALSDIDQFKEACTGNRLIDCRCIQLSSRRGKVEPNSAFGELQVHRNSLRHQSLCKEFETLPLPPGEFPVAMPTRPGNRQESLVHAVRQKHQVVLGRPTKISPVLSRGV